MKKEKLLRLYEAEFGREEVEKARRNHHARRPPRPCGFTVHIAEGCSGGCLYCYVRSEPKLVELSPKALVYSLLLNPKFELKKSFIAVGSVCEPLDFPEYTREFLQEVLKLGNPTQISTKEVNYEMRDLLKKFDTLVSMCIASDELARVFEPKRPPPSERLEFCREIRGGVFLRPILPMIEIDVYKKSLERIAEYTDKVILGNLRVTGEVKKKLGIERLTKDYFRRKEILEKYAKEELGLIVFRSACCSNALKHEIPCWNECWKKGFCSNCPNECRRMVGELY